MLIKKEKIENTISEFERYKFNDKIFTFTNNPTNKNELIIAHNENITIFDLETSEIKKQIKGHNEIILTLIYDKKGKRFLSAGYDKIIKLWSIKNNEIELIRIYKGHEKLIKSLAFSSDNKYILSSSADKTIKLWSTETGELIHTFYGHMNWVISAIFINNDKLIVSGSYDNTIKIWDFETKKINYTFHEHTDSIKTIDYNSNNKLLITGSADKTLKIWDIEHKKHLQTYQLNDIVNNVCFDSSGQFFLGATNKEYIKIFNVNTKKIYKTLIGTTNEIEKVIFTSKNIILASDFSGNLYKWKI